MPKTIKELVEKLKSKIKPILVSEQDIIQDQDGLIYLSGEFNIAEVYVLLKKNENNTSEAIEENLQAFIKFARRMWDSAENSQKIPHLKADTHINQINLTLVVMLAELLVPQNIENRSQKINEKIWELLIYPLKRHDFGDVHNIHHFVMSDDNTTMINVFECLHEYEMRLQRDKNKKIRHTHPVEGGPEYLSETELQRVLNYSNKLKDYYEALMQDKVDDKIGAKRRDAKAVLNDKKTIIGYSYGIGSKESNTGWEKLKDQIYGDVKTGNDYLKRLHRLPEVSWEAFAKNIKLSELIKLTTGKEEADYTPYILPTLMANSKLYRNNDEKHNRAVLYTFFFLYWRKRKLEPNYTGSLWGSDRVTKCNAARLILGFLESERPLSDFPKFLASSDCENYLSALTSGYSNYWEALPKMVAVTKKVCSMELISEEVQSVEYNHKPPIYSM